MKKLLGILLATIVLSSFSNEKGMKGVKFKFTKAAVNDFNNITRLSAKGDRALAFSSLSAIEKSAVWEYKFSLYFEKYKKFPEKLAFLVEIHEEFTHYSYQPDEIEKFRKYAKENGVSIYMRAKSILGNDVEAYNLIYQLVPLKVSEFDPVPKKQAGRNELKPYPCDCIVGLPGGCSYWDTSQGILVFGYCSDYNCEQPIPGGGACGAYGTTPCDGWVCRF